MNRKALIQSAILATLIGATGLACSNKPLSPFTTDRDVTVRGTDEDGSQFLAVLSVTYNGSALTQLEADNWVDERVLANGGLGSKGGPPKLNTIISKRLQNVQGDVTDEEAFKAALIADIETGLKQFNSQTVANIIPGEVVYLEASLGETPIVSLIDIYSTAESNFASFLEGSDAYYDISSGKVSATDSGIPDGFTSASVIDKGATERYGRVVRANFQCPNTAPGNCKVDEEMPYTGLPNTTKIRGLEGGNSALPVVPTSPVAIPSN